MVFKKTKALLKSTRDSHIERVCEAMSEQRVYYEVLDESKYRKMYKIWPLTCPLKGCGKEAIWMVWWMGVNEAEYFPACDEHKMGEKIIK